MLFKGGVKEAAKMLSALSRSERERIISDISKKDPKMAELLKQNLVTFEDLRFLTVKMLAELLREIDIVDLSLGLRISSKELREHILSNVSKSIREEIEDTLNGSPLSVAKIEESIEKVMRVVRLKADKGELILSESNDIMV